MIHSNIMNTELESLPSNVADAKASGSSYFFTGKPCKKGHIDKRHTNGRACVTCKREYREATSTKTDAYNKEYYAANAEAIKERIYTHRRINGR